MRNYHQVLNPKFIICFTSTVFLLFCLKTTAQVKVGDNPNLIRTASLLELESTDKGFVLPRVSLSGSVTSPAPLAADILQGTVVYNTNTAFTGGVGLYLWSGSAWMAVTPTSVGSTDAWKLTGNSGTNPSANFIGTADAQPLIFKVNGQKAGYINSSGAATNTSFGYQSLNAISGGNDNTATGYFSLLNNTTGNSNTGVGVSSLRNNTIGSANTGIGWNTLFNNSTGNNNTALGSNALFLNTTGTNNIAIGNSADVTSGSLTNTIAIGYNAKVAISNAIVLGNTTDNVKVGIGTTSPATRLDVIGTGSFTAAGASLRLQSIGTGSHTYAEFYPDGAGSARGTWLGYGSNGSKTMSVVNEIPAGDILLSTAQNFYMSAGGSSRLYINGSTGNTGIGTTSSTATLHVKGTVRLEDITNGLLTADASGNISTTSISAINGSNWSLTGNSGTNPASNFIGTTNAQPLIFKVNNQNAGRLDYLNAAANTSFGYQSLNANTSGINNTATGYSALAANTTGNENIANGSYTLLKNTTGLRNVASGYTALNNNTTGNENTANGFIALLANITGSNNVASGSNAMLGNTSGSFNAAYGSQALQSNSTGNNNTAIGSGADVTSDDLTNATAIGYNAKVAVSNAMVLGNGSINVGIGTSSPATALDVRTTDGSARITVGTTTNSGGGIAFGNPSHGIQRGYPTINDDNNVGLYTTAANVYLSADGTATNQFVLTNNGNVGIGTTASPGQKLEVAGNVQISGSGNGLKFPDGTTQTTAAATTTASNGLTITGNDVQLGGSLTKNTTINAGATRFFAVTGNALDGAPAIDQQNTTGPNIISASTQWQSFTCGKDGLLSRVDLGLFTQYNGIGTYNYTLDVYTGTGTGGTLIATATVSYTSTSTGSFSLSFPFSDAPALLLGQVYTISLSTPNPGKSWLAGDNPYSGGVADITYGNYDYRFTTYIQGLFPSTGLIVKNGMVGINASNPLHPLTVQANTGGAMLGFYNSLGTDKYNFSLTSGGLNLSESNVAAGRIFIKDGGNVGIGSTTPSYKLDVNGGIRCVGAVITTSDARLKQNIRPLGSALDGIMKLRGVRYTFRRQDFPAMALPQGEQIGVLAQEVEKIYPELVSTDAQGYKAVNYAQLTPVLIEAVKEQQKEIEAAKAKNEALSNDVETLKAQVKLLMEKIGASIVGK